MELNTMPRLEGILKKLKNELPGYSRTVLTTFLFMFAAHSFAWFSFHFIQDSVDIMGYNYYPNMVSLGRWGSFLCDYIVGTPILPWYFALLNIIAWSFVFYEVFKVFNIPNYYQIIFIGVFTTGLKFIIQNAVHIEMIGWESFFILLPIIPTILINNKKKILANVAVVICTCLILSSIQQNMGLLIGFLLFYMFIEISNNDVTWKSFWTEGVLYIIDILIGGGFYVIGLYAATKYTGVTISTDQISSIGALSGVSIMEYFFRIPKIYIHILKVFLSKNSYCNNVVRLINFIFIIGAMVSFIIWIKAQMKNRKRLLQGIILIMLIPLGLDSIYIFAAHHMYALNEYPVLFLYLVPVIIIASINKSFDLGNNPIRVYATMITLVCSVVFIIHNIHYANISYLYEKLTYEHSASCLQTIWEDMIKSEGYEPGVTKVAFVGDPEKSLLRYNGFLGGYYEDVLDHSCVISYQWNWKSYYEFIKGSPIELMIDTSEIEDDIAVKNMPSYPDDGYCKMTGDALIVKISD